jgi:hypothetical protein
VTGLPQEVSDAQSCIDLVSLKRGLQDLAGLFDDLGLPLRHLAPEARSNLCITVPSTGIMECFLDDLLPSPIYGTGLHARISLNRNASWSVRFRTAILAPGSENV